MAPADLQQKASDYFKALFTRPEAHDVQVTQHDELAPGGQLHPQDDGSGSIEHDVLAQLIGQGQLNITATGEVVWGIKKLNLALALDNTGSMASSNKMTDLKDRRAQSTHHVAERGEAARRRQGRDHSVRGRRQCRHRHVGDILDRLDRLGGRQRHLQQVRGYTKKSTCESHGKIWTPAPHSRERLRQRSRPEQRRQHHHDRSPAVRSTVSGPIRPPIVRPRSCRCPTTGPR